MNIKIIIEKLSKNPKENVFNRLMVIGMISTFLAFITSPFLTFTPKGIKIALILTWTLPLFFYLISYLFFKEFLIKRNFDSQKKLFKKHYHFLQDELENLRIKKEANMEIIPGCWGGSETVQLETSSSEIIDKEKDRFYNKEISQINEILKKFKTA